MDLLGWIAVLDDDQVVGLEERTPLLEEVEIADRGDDNVQLIDKFVPYLHYSMD